MSVCPIVASDVLENQSAFQGVRSCSMSDLVGLISEKLREGIGVYVFVQILVDHAYGRRAAACEAFDELDAVISIGADRNGVVHSLALAFGFNSSCRA